MRRPGGPKPLEQSVLTVADAVLCSEMGVHFSPCGRLMAACVACQARVQPLLLPAADPVHVTSGVALFAIRGVVSSANLLSSRK
jgi:hypothetical protein